jgi:hypothetical protein
MTPPQSGAIMCRSWGAIGPSGGRLVVAGRSDGERSARPPGKEGAWPAPNPTPVTRTYPALPCPRFGRRFSDFAILRFFDFSIFLCPGQPGVRVRGGGGKYLRAGRAGGCQRAARAGGGERGGNGWVPLVLSFVLFSAECSRSAAAQWELIVFFVSLLYDALLSLTWGSSGLS